MRAVFDPRNALSGRDITDFVAKHSRLKVVVLILSDLKDPLPLPASHEVYLLNLTYDPARGTHWAILFRLNSRCYMFDSFRVNLDLIPDSWNGKRHIRRWNVCGFQNSGTVVCGHYTALCICFPSMFRNKDSNAVVKCTKVRSKQGEKIWKKQVINDCNVYLLYKSMS